MNTKTKCKICDKIFNDINVLLRHLSIFHTLRSTYVCIHEECSRQFVSIKSLKKHVLNCDKIRKVYKADEKKNSNELSTTFCKVENGNVLDKIPKNNTQLLQNEQVIDENIIEHELFEFISKLYSNPSITNTVVDEVSQELSNFTKKISNFYNRKLKSQLPVEFHKSIDNCLDLNCLENSSTKFKRFQYLKKMGCLILAKQFQIGEINDNKNIKGTAVRIKKKCYGYLVPLRVVLKIFFELPNVFQEVMDFIKRETPINDTCDSSKVYTSFFSGKLWKKIKKKFRNKIVFPIFLYYDDFEINNPLSVTATIYKIGGMYFSIIGIPPQFASLLENVFLAQFIFTEDQKGFKNDKCFCKIIEELKHLFSEGINIQVDNENYTIYFVVVGILGDNLGINSLFGFSESFISDFFCRFCQVSKYVAQKLCIEKTELLRNPDNYKEDLESFQHGVKSNCVFNELPCFNNVVNWTCDIMHDFFVGVCRYDMARIIKHFIDKNFFTLEHLNERLKYFDYDEVDRGSRISSIKAKHIKNGYLITTSAQMSALVTYFSIIVGDLIDEDDPVWEFYLTLYEIIYIISKSEISEDEIEYLKHLIQVHNEQFVALFKEHLRPKFHLITHCPTCIQLMGPLKHLSCEKHEAFHQRSKMYAKIANSRVNILHTLSCKLQLRLAYRFFTRHGLLNSTRFGAVKEVLQETHTKAIMYECSYVRVNGTKYRAGYGICLGCDKENDPIVGVISRVLKFNSNEVLLMYKICSMIGFNNHLKSYQIVPINSSEKYIHITNKNYVKPFKIHVTAQGKHVVSRRDLF